MGMSELPDNATEILIEILLEIEDTDGNIDDINCLGTSWHSHLYYWR